jgi:cellobiose phosphorylase
MSDKQKGGAVYDFTTSNVSIPPWWGCGDREFGNFSQDGREYVITTGDTPRPWLNYLGNDDYGLVFGNHGEGFSWYKAMTARVTRYTKAEYVPREPDSGRGVYMQSEGGELSSIAVDDKCGHYRCTHGLGYSLISNRVGDILADWRVFVPCDDPVEIWQVRLRNDSCRSRRFSIIAILEWQLGQYSYSPPCNYVPLSNPDKDVQVCWNAADHVFVAENRAKMPMKFGGFFRSLSPVAAAQTSAKGVRGNPLSLKAIDFDNKDCRGAPCLSAFRLDLELAPGGRSELLFTAGVFEDKAQCSRLVSKYDKPAADDAFEKLEKYWDGVIEKNINISTPIREVDLWCNVRLKHLLHITKRWTRGLDRGYRDILQDLRGFLAIDPEEVRKLLLQTLAFQYCGGAAVRQYSVTATAHDLRDYSDSPIWIADVLTSYIKETGDFGILDQQVPYFDGGSGTVYEHNLRALRRLFEDRGDHGLCHIRHGDWNDALEGIGKQGRAEGVWLSMALYWAMNLTRELAVFIEDKESIEMLTEWMRVVKDAVNDAGWQGRWYAYALDDYGRSVGSPENTEGRLHLNPQSFAVFTGIAGRQRTQLCLKAIDEYLDTKIGPLLVWPCYKNERVGRIWRMEPGTFENGSMYFHGAAFKMLADASAGRPDKALDTLLKILPSNPRNPLSRSTIEPYSLGNYYCGCGNKLSGLNIYSHFTGSYSWIMKTVIEKIIGIRAGYSGLEIEPNLPSDWESVKVRRSYRGKNYHIIVNKSSFLSIPLESC